MKGTVLRFIRFVASVTALASLLLFCQVFAESYNDERFEVYSNMNTKRTGVLYIVPNLYRQDAAYKYVKTFPVVVSGGVEYVPISMFSLYSYITVTYSKINSNFYMTNTKTGKYLSFDVTQDIVETSDGKTMEMKTNIFYRTRYIPARAVAEHMGVICEAYDDKERGIFAFRIRDNNASYSFEELLKQYLPSSHFPQNNDDNIPPKENEDTSNDNPKPRPEDTKDPVLSVAKRQVVMMFEQGNPEHMHETLKAVSDNNISASFAVSGDYILSSPSGIRSIITKGQSVAVTLSEEEYLSVLTAKNVCEKVLQYLEEANEALSTVCQRKTRICVVPEDVSLLLESKDTLKKFLSEHGYVLFSANTETNYKNGAYSIYSQLSQGIVKAYPQNTQGLVKMIIPVSEKSGTVATNLCKYINKYPNFTAISANETMA